MFYINPSIPIRFTHIHVYTCIHFILNAVCSGIMCPLAIYGNSIFIYNVKNEGKEGGNYNYDYLANASRKISMF